MNITSIKKKLGSLLTEASFIIQIKNDAEYQQALSLMDSLFDDYDTYKPIIDILAVSIKNWEDHADEFVEFNQRIEKMSDVDVLKFLMEQHHLSISDLPEIGSKSLVSRIVNSRDRHLTKKHIAALSQRFMISPSVFFGEAEETKIQSPIELGLSHHKPPVLKNRKKPMKKRNKQKVA